MLHLTIARQHTAPGLAIMTRLSMIWKRMNLGSSRSGDRTSESPPVPAVESLRPDGKGKKHGRSSRWVTSNYFLHLAYSRLAGHPSDVVLPLAQFNCHLPTPRSNCFPCNWDYFCFARSLERHLRRCFRLSRTCRQCFAIRVLSTFRLRGNLFWHSVPAARGSLLERNETMARSETVLVLPVASIEATTGTTAVADCELRLLQHHRCDEEGSR